MISLKNNIDIFFEEELEYQAYDLNLNPIWVKLKDHEVKIKEVVKCQTNLGNFYIGNDQIIMTNTGLESMKDLRYKKNILTNNGQIYPIIYNSIDFGVELCVQLVFDRSNILIPINGILVKH